MRLPPRPYPTLVALPALFLLAFLMRTPLLGLPLEGESARLAAAADRLADGEGAWRLGRAPLVPALVAGLSRGFGVRPTPALRWLDALAAAALAPLAWALAWALRRRHGEALRIGGLVALHPLGVYAAGGVAPSADSVAGVLVLGALVLLASPSPVRRRMAGVPILLLCAAHGGALAFVPLLLVLQAVREPGPRIQTAGVLVGAGALAGALATWVAWAGRPELGAALLWVLAASLGILLPGVPGGLRRLVDSPLGRTWVAGAGLATLVWLLGQPFPTLAVLPLIVLAGWVGTRELLGRRRVPLGAAALATCALASLGLVSGGIQAALAPDAPAAAGRLHQLGAAVRAAAREAGSEGWIVLAVCEDQPEAQASLADLTPGHWSWAPTPSPARAGALRRLGLFPASSLPADRLVTVVARAGEATAIETFAGAGIYHQELLRRVGPYVVLRARRP